MKTKTLSIILTAILCATMVFCTTRIVDALKGVSLSIPHNMNVSTNYPSFDEAVPDEIADCFFEIKKADKETKTITVHLGFLLKEVSTDAVAVFKYGANSEILTYNNGSFEGTFDVNDKDLPSEKLILQITEGNIVRTIDLTSSDTINYDEDVMNFFTFAKFFEPTVEHNLVYLTTESTKDGDVIGVEGYYSIRNDHYQSVTGARIAMFVDGKELSESSVSIDLDTENDGFIEYSTDVYGDYYSFNVEKNTDFTMALILTLKDGSELTYDIPAATIDDDTEYTVSETEKVVLF